MGLSAGYSIEARVLGDATALIRGDRFLTTDLTSKNLTEWGLRECQGDTSKNFATIFGEKLLTRHLGDQNFPPKSIRTVFPFSTPEESMVCFLFMSV